MLVQSIPPFLAQVRRQDNEITERERERERVYSRNGREHALVQAEEKVGNLGATDRGLGEGLHETEVAEIANIGAARMGEG